MSTDSDAVFTKKLLKSREDNNRFALRYENTGVQLSMPPLKIVGHANWREGVDGGDFILNAIVEHKVRPDLCFTDCESYEYKTVYIDEVYKWNDKRDNNRTPLFYVVENCDRTHAVVIPGYTREHWVVERFPCHGRMCDVYAIDKRRVRFCPSDQVFLTQPPE